MDRDSTQFRDVLNYMRSGDHTLILENPKKNALRREFGFCSLPWLREFEEEVPWFGLAMIPDTNWGGLTDQTPVPNNSPVGNYCEHGPSTSQGPGNYMGG